MVRIRRRDLLPALFLATVLLIVWLIIFLFIPPDNFFMPFVFLVVTFLWVFFLSMLVLGNTRRGLLAASGVLLFMLLNYYGAGNYLTTLLIVGILLSIEYYFSRQS